MIIDTPSCFVPVLQFINNGSHPINAIYFFILVFLNIFSNLYNKSFFVLFSKFSKLNLSINILDKN
jgi:hypothetical protein